MDCRFEQAHHLVVLQLTHHILRQELVFQSVVNQVFGLYTAVEQAFHLINHTLVETRMKPFRNLLPTQFAVYINTYYQRLYLRKITFLNRTLFVVFLNLDGTDCTLYRIHIGSVMKSLVLLQPFRQTFYRLASQSVSQLRVFGNRNQPIASQHRFEIHSRSAAEHRHHAARGYILVRLQKIALILKNIILVSGRHDIYKMIRNLLAVNNIVGKVLTRTDIHATVYLTAVGADNLSVKFCSKFGSQGCFSRCGRSKNSNHIHSAKIIFF